MRNVVRGAGSGEREAGSGERGAGSRKREAGSGKGMGAAGIRNRGVGSRPTYEQGIMWRGQALADRYLGQTLTRGTRYNEPRHNPGEEGRP